ncbi:hypothetical protein NLI96_g11163 [Meripilus lineatus]|uniref:Uncharacterized protein n=1 Tax=Meripilus lineatus TaxID=2056292 RepID=A0AAD5USD5_9APHY|nr:hypothetical protein NLI96_g11163 [Physisporinus lineatus]
MSGIHSRVLKYKFEESVVRIFISDLRDSGAPTSAIGEVPAPSCLPPRGPWRMTRLILLANSHEVSRRPDSDPSMPAMFPEDLPALSCLDGYAADASNEVYTGADMSISSK